MTLKKKLSFLGFLRKTEIKFCVPQFMTERIFSLMFFVADNLESKSGENPFANSQTVSDLLLSG